MQLKIIRKEEEDLENNTEHNKKMIIANHLNRSV